MQEGKKNWVEIPIFVLFLFFVIIHRILFFDYYYMPISDFLNIRETTQFILTHSLPQDYRSGPFFPLITAIVSTIIHSSSDPVRLAAELLNFVFFTGSVCLIFLISRQFLTWGAFITTLLFTLHPITSGELISQPLIEDSLLFFTTLSIYLHLRGKKTGAYLFAGISSITRYEGFLLVPVFAIGDLLRKNKIRSILVRAAPCSLGIITWLVISRLRTETINTYFTDLVNSGVSRWNFLKMVIFSIIRFLPQGYFDLWIRENLTTVEIMFFSSQAKIFFIVIQIVILSFVATGIYVNIKRGFNASVMLYSFLFSYIFIHSLYPFTLEKHIYPVLWIFDLSILKGVEFASEKIRSMIKEKNAFIWKVAVPAISITAMVLMIFFLPGYTRSPSYLSQEGSSKIMLSKEISADEAPYYRISSFVITPSMDTQKIFIQDGYLFDNQLLTDKRKEYLHEQGYAYLLKIPDVMLADFQKNNGRSELVMLEDGIPLPFPHSFHDTIRSQGWGRYSHWRDPDESTAIIFSASDNSDPNLNGRTYSAGYLFHAQEELELPLVNQKISKSNMVNFWMRAEPLKGGAAGESESVPVDFELTDTMGRTAKASIKIKNPYFEKYFVRYYSAKPWEPEFYKRPDNVFILEKTGDFRFDNLRELKFSIKGFTNNKMLKIFVDKINISHFDVNTYPFLYFGYLLLFLGFLFFSLDKKSKIWILYFVVLGFTGHFLIIGELSSAKDKSEVFKLAYANYYKVGEWYRFNSRENDKLLTINDHIVKYASLLPDLYFDHIGEYKSRSLEEFLNDMNYRGITYVVMNKGDDEFLERNSYLKKFFSPGLVESKFFELVEEILISDKYSKIYRFKRELL